jgi:hypothetical protein
MKFVIRNEKPENVVEFWLDDSDGDINLKVKKAGYDAEVVLFITPEGVLNLVEGLSEGFGLSLDTDEKIKVEAPE